MKKLFFDYFVFLFFLIVLQLKTAYTQVGTEFPIEVGPDSTFALGFAEDNTKYMILMRKEKSNGADIVVQFHSKSDHSLIGRPIVLGSTSIPAEYFDYAIPQVAFDGTRFLVVWSDGENGGIKYRFIHSQTFELSQLFSDPSLPIYIGGIKALHYNSVTNKYLLVSSIKVQNNLYHIYNFIGTDGFLYSSSSLTSFPVRKEFSVSYAGGKYLICFIPKSNVPNLYYYQVAGQLLDENGTLIGSTFIIDNSTAPNDNPLYVLFDGNYHICFYPEDEPTGWKIYARKITTDGIVNPNRSLITSDGHIMPFAILGNYKMLVTWTRVPYQNTPGVIKGKFLDTNLNPLGDEFIIFQPLNNKMPVGSMGVWDGSKFYVYTTRANFTPLITPNDTSFIITNGDVYGVSITDPTKVEEEVNLIQNYELLQNFPNPFNSTTQIKFSLKESQRIKMELYNLLGEKITTLLNEEKEKGLHTLRFDAAKFNLNAGVYFLKLIAGDFVSIKKMVYLK
jgi:hypothetical protein